MAEPDFIVPPPGLIPAAPPADAPVRRPPDAPPRILPAIAAPPGVAPPPGIASPPVRVEAPATVVGPGVWRIRGTGIDVLLGRPVVLGRDPSVDPARPADPLAVTDPARSVSKTHARIEVVDDLVVVTDLHSTNGTRVQRADGESRELHPGRGTPVPCAATLLLGEYPVRLDRVPADTV
ncbi:FHA domain-containing protein [Agromyces sp. NPDC058484]|uniref:FHA domain-containing protein n=1 Tax=Agromyces sp. NPDC058484 TaxID=3346524 RepID=UPI0036507733